MNDRDFTKYDWTRSYQWNYEHAPDPAETEAIRVPALPGSWTFCGMPVASPLGIPAGPLLNGKWVVHYAQLGFDVLTYKTVRSRYRACYDLPNLQPIAEARVSSGQVTRAVDVMQGSWAISFGMPSMSPEVWRRDIVWTREQLSDDKLLVVSVVATPDPDWGLEEVAEDYARCAGWAVESGADCIELNFSCPNVASVDGQLYQDPNSARQVLHAVRQRIGGKPLIIKIGYLADEQSAEALLQAAAGMLQAVSMTNCLACKVQADQGLLFDGQPRGIGGEAIRVASLSQVQLFANLIRRRKWPISVIGVGGVSRSEHVLEYLRAGAESIQVATAAMLEPQLALAIKPALAGRLAELG